MDKLLVIVFAENFWIPMQSRSGAWGLSGHPLPGQLKVWIKSNAALILVFTQQGFHLSPAQHPSQRDLVLRWADMVRPQRRALGGHSSGCWTYSCGSAVLWNFCPSFRFMVEMSLMMLDRWSNQWIPTPASFGVISRNGGWKGLGNCFLLQGWCQGNHTSQSGHLSTRSIHINSGWWTLRPLNCALRVNLGPV